MDSLSTILAESIVGMGITIALLALLALIFHLIGKFGQKGFVASPPEIKKKEPEIGGVIPYIAAAVYLYRVGEDMKAKKMKEVVTTMAPSVKRPEVIPKSIAVNSSREEWKKCGRRDCLR